MPHIEYNTLIIKGFKTFTGDPVRINLAGGAPGFKFVRGRNEFEPELGSNGAAKSSLFDALCWCLYGRTIKNLRNPDVVPWSGKGYPDVACYVYVGKDCKVVRRFMHPKNTLTLDGVEASQDNIDRLTMPFEVFRHAVLFGQRQPLYFDLSPKEKMEVLSLALNLDRWESRSDAARDRAGEVSRDLEEARQELSEADSRLGQVETLLKQAEARATGWEQEQKEEAKSRAAQRTELEGRAKGLLARKDEAELALDSAGTELKALERNLKELAAERDTANQAFTRAKLALENDERSIENLEREIEGLADAEECPTCGQNLKGSSLDKHIQEIKSEVKTLQTKVDRGIPASIRVRHTKAVEALAAALEHADTFKERMYKAQTTLNVVTPDLVRAQTLITELKQQGTKEKVNPHREEVTELKKRQRTINSKMDDLEDEIAKLEKEHARTAFWIKGFKDVRLQLLEEFLQELEITTNALLPESGLRGWEVRYDVERETKKGTIQAGLNVAILSPSNDKAVKWECWSGGEEHRLRVVGALALAEVLLSHAGVTTNLEVLDEPTTSLSVEGVQDLCEYLSVRARTLEKDVWMIDHMAVESSHFSEIITVVKDDNGVSYVEKA